MRTSEVAGAIRQSAVARRASGETESIGCDVAVPAVISPWLTPRGEAALEILPVTMQLSGNSAYADDRNNGVLWSGRGLSTALSIGFALRTGPLSVGLYPTIAWQQNQAFDVQDTISRAGYSSLTYAWRIIDLPQRFGTEAFVTASPGQSYAKLSAFGVQAGVSTENLWWGPGQQNSIILGNSSEGFPHIFVGTSRRIRTPIGALAAEAVWGRLQESEYFDTASANDTRGFAGLTASFEPRFLEGLQLGVNRVFIFRPSDVSHADYISRLFNPFFRSQLVTEDNPSGHSPDDQLASLFARWLFRESKAEVYAEWAREDHNVDWWDLLNEPDHSQAYTLGFQKVVTARKGWVRLQGELTHLGANTTFRSGRGSGRPVTYYEHNYVLQGYTHKGQILGAWIGPGSDTQYLGADVVYPRFTLGAYVERIAHDNDAYYARFARVYTRHGHDAEIGVGLRGLVGGGAPGFGVSWRAGWNKRRNRNFLGLDGTNRNYRLDENLSLELHGIAHIGRLLKPSSLERR